MNEDYKERVIIHAESLFKTFRHLKASEYDERARAILELKEDSLDSTLARKTLRQLIYDDDGAIRILAAEALSQTKSYPLDAIPVLQAVLDVCQVNKELISARENWIRISLGALSKYEEYSASAENSVWSYLYTQDNINLQLYAIKVVSRIAKVSNASWVILCLLCRHENQAISNFTKDIMKSQEFKDYMIK